MEVVNAKDVKMLLERLAQLFKAVQQYEDEQGESTEIDFKLSEQATLTSYTEERDQPIKSLSIDCTITTPVNDNVVPVRLLNELKASEVRITSTKFEIKCQVGPLLIYEV